MVRERTAIATTENVYRKDEKTGEMIPIPAIVVNKTTTDFEKIWVAEMMEALGRVGKKKIKVAYYILSKRDKLTNCLVQTQGDIAEACNVSRQTVISAIKALEEAGLLVLKGKAGLYQVKTEKLDFGTSGEVMGILQLYQQAKAAK